MKEEIVQVIDKEDLISIMKEFNCLFANPLDNIMLNDLANKFHEKAEVYKAIVDNKCVGYIAFYANNTENKEVYISQIAVDKEYRGYGIGKKLLAKSLQVAKEKQMKCIKLEVYTQNIKAIEFYERFGFKENKNENSNKKRHYLLGIE